MAFLLRGTWQPGVDGMGCFRIPDFAPISPVLSPSASRFRCFGAPINPLLSGETPKLKKGKKNEIYIYVCRYVWRRISEPGKRSDTGRPGDPGRPFRVDPFFWLRIVEFVIPHWIALNLSWNRVGSARSGNARTQLGPLSQKSRSLGWRH